MGAAEQARLIRPTQEPRRVIVDALAARYGGTAYAAVQVATHLAEDPLVEEVVVVARRDSIVARGLQPRPRLRLLALRNAKRAELPRRLVWEALALPRFLRRSPGSLLTWSGMLPRKVPGRVTCYLANPVMFHQHDFANRVRRWAARRTARTARHLIVPTNAMASLVARAARVPVEVVPLGVDHGRFSPANSPGDEVLCVADFYPHKRHDLVLDAWAALPEPRPVLRLVGDTQVPCTNYSSVAAHAERYRQMGTIVFGSQLRLGDLVDAYRHARVLVLASHYESFALPLLEAQACGVPAVVRDLPALRETGGDGTAYVRDDTPETWTRELSRLISDERAHGQARAKALAHAQRFSWKGTADGLLLRLASA